MKDIAGNEIHIAIAVCCREWEVAYGYQWGRCGYCGERPTFLRLVGEGE